MSPIRLEVSPGLEASTPSLSLSEQSDKKPRHTYNNKMLLSCLNASFKSFFPHCFLFCLWAPPRRAWLPLITPAQSGTFMHCCVSHLSLLFPRLSNNSSFNLSSKVRCFSSLLTFVAFLAPVCPYTPHVLVSVLGPTLHVSLFVSRKEGPHTSACWQVTLMQPRMLIMFILSWVKLDKSRACIVAVKKKSIPCYFVCGEVKL